MVSRSRLGLLVLAGLLVSAPLLAAEEGKSPAEDSNLLEDVIDGVGGVLKILVGPPLTPPAPLNLPGHYRPVDPEPAPAKPPEPAVAAPLPSPAPPPAPEPVPTPAVITVAPPVQQPLPAVTPPPKPKAATLPPEPPPPPLARPAPAAPPVAVVAPQPPRPQGDPGCVTRIAATATVDQAAKLRRCK